MKDGQTYYKKLKSFYEKRQHKQKEKRNCGHVEVISNSYNREKNLIQNIEGMPINQYLKKTNQ